MTQFDIRLAIVASWKRNYLTLCHEIGWRHASLDAAPLRHVSHPSSRSGISELGPLIQMDMPKSCVRKEKECRGDCSHRTGNVSSVTTPFYEPSLFRSIKAWSWPEHCTASRKDAGSISDGVTGIFQWLNPSGRIVALGSTQPLIEMSTRNPSWG
jgi:hypothetical protein